MRRCDRYLVTAPAHHHKSDPSFQIGLTLRVHRAASVVAVGLHCDLCAILEDHDTGPHKIEAIRADLGIRCCIS